jgi:Exocyst complex component Sec3, C-terminal
VLPPQAQQPGAPACPARTGIDQRSGGEPADSLTVGCGPVSRSRSRSPRQSALEHYGSSDDSESESGESVAAVEERAGTAPTTTTSSSGAARDSAAELSEELADWLGECFREAEAGLRALLESTAKQDSLSLVSALADSVPYLESGLRPLLGLTALLQQRAKQLVNAHLDVYAGQLAQIPTPLKRAGLLSAVRSLPALLDRMAAKADRHQHGEQVLRTAYQKLALAALSCLSRLYSAASASSTVTGAGADSSALASAHVDASGDLAATTTAASSSGSSSSEPLLSKEQELACVVGLENFYYLAAQLQHRSNPALLEFLAAAEQGYERTLDLWAGHLAHELAPSAWAFFGVVADLVPRLRRPADVSFHEVASTDVLARRVLQPLQRTALFKQLARLMKRTRKGLTMPELLLDAVWGLLSSKLCAEFASWERLLAQCYPEHALEVNGAALREELRRLLLESKLLLERNALKKKKRKDGSKVLLTAGDDLVEVTSNHRDDDDSEVDNDDHDDGDNDDDAHGEEIDAAESSEDTGAAARTHSKRSKLRKLRRRKKSKASDAGAKERKNERKEKERKEKGHEMTEQTERARKQQERNDKGRLGKKEKQEKRHSTRKGRKK